MGWKNWLSWKKIVLFVIIFLIFSFIPTWPVLVCGNWECMPPSKGTFWSSLISLKNREFYDFGYLPVLILIFIVSIVINLIISAVMLKVWEIKKSKERRK